MGSRGDDMNNYTLQFLACYIWIEHTYSNHIGHCEKVKSETHIRYSFYFKNQTSPFFVLESSLENPVIREWVRFESKGVTLNRVGIPQMSSDEGEQIRAVLFNTTRFEWVRV